MGNLLAAGGYWPDPYWPVGYWQPTYWGPEAAAAVRGAGRRRRPPPAEVAMPAAVIPPAMFERALAVEARKMATEVSVAEKIILEKMQGIQDAVAASKQQADIQTNIALARLRQNLSQLGDDRRAIRSMRSKPVLKRARKRKAELEEEDKKSRRRKK